MKTIRATASAIEAKGSAPCLFYMYMGITQGYKKKKLKKQ